MHFDFDQHGAAFFDRQLHRLRVLVSDQSDRILEDADARISSHCISVVMLLEEHDGLPVTTIAEALDYSHQLINYRLSLLEDGGFVEKSPDLEDRRRNLVSLTPPGREVARRVRSVLPAIDASLQELFTELGVDLHQFVAQAVVALHDRPLAARGQR